MVQNEKKMPNDKPYLCELTKDEKLWVKNQVEKFTICKQRREHLIRAMLTWGTGVIGAGVVAILTGLWNHLTGFIK